MTTPDEPTPNEAVQASLARLRDAMPYSLRWTHNTGNTTSLDLPPEQGGGRQHTLKPGMTYRIRLAADVHNPTAIRAVVRRGGSAVTTEWVEFNHAEYPPAAEFNVSVAPGEVVSVSVQEEAMALRSPNVSGAMTITPTPAWEPPI